MKNETIQVGGKTYMKARVVMLATEKESRLTISIDGKCLELYNNAINTKNSQHLYILSSEEINEGDWQYDSHYKRIEQYFHGKATGMSIYKIIATTDGSLKSGDWIHNDAMVPLPRPSSEFLQAYCKANGKIEEVLVELEESRFGGIGIDSRYEYKLKVASDNTITIKKVGKAYSEEEIDKYISMHEGLIEGLKNIREFAERSNLSKSDKSFLIGETNELLKQAEANKKSSCHIESRIPTKKIKNMKNQTLIPILLPTEEASFIWETEITKELTTHQLGSGCRKFHLYLCSDLQISEGDWYINLLDNKIWKAERDHKNTSGIIGSKLKKIEFTTDSKLWNKSSNNERALFEGGVPAINNKTEAQYYPKGHTETILVNFLEEFCKRYNQKSNEKGFDAEVLAYSECIKQTGTDNPKWKSGFIAGYQSNAGGFSSEDMRDLAWKMVSVPRSSDTKEIDDMITEFIQSIQSKSKSELVIEVEMEVPMHAHVVGNYPDPVIKLDGNGQPILRFRLHP